MDINWFLNIPFFSIFVPLFCSIITMFMKSEKTAYNCNLVTLGLVCIMSFMLCSYTVANELIFTFTMGNFPAPWGNELRAGPLESLMAMAFTMVIFLTILGSKNFIIMDIPTGKHTAYFTVLNALVGSILALIYASDVFTAYIFMEINTITACALVVVKGDGKSVVGILQYLLISLVGSGLFLLGVSILYSITGYLSFNEMQGVIIELMATGEYEYPFLVVSGVMFLGIAIKSGLFPFHSWLGAFHPVASSTFSAIHSSVVAESYIILGIKLIFSVFTVDIIHSLKISDIFFIFGFMGMIYGSLIASKEDRMKYMLAFSSVAQIGYIFLGIGIGSVVGMTASCFHIIAHAFSKSMLFLCCGRFIDGSNGNLSIYYMRGIALCNPIAGIGYTIGGMSMIGIPLLAGFTSKVYFATASLYEPIRMVFVLGVLGISMVLNALYFIPSIMAIWTPPKNEFEGEHKSILEELHWDSSPKIFNFVILVFIFCNIFLGIFYTPVINAIELGVSLLMDF